MKKHKRGIVFYLLVSFILVYIGVQIFQVRSKISEKEKELAQYQDKIAQQTVDNTNLQKELDGELTQEQIERIARERLGLISPDEQIYINVTGD